MSLVEEAKKFISPLRIDGLKGRVLRIPCPDKKTKQEILFIYGSHASLERGFGMAEDLSQYGNITVPDLPGFGGMESFYKIGKKPELDNFADYLALFIKQHYGNQKITLVGFSLGSAIVTRTLQKYPELTRQINLLISYAGLSHHNEFIFPDRRKKVYKALSLIGSNRLFAFFFRYVFLNRFVLRRTYSKTYLAKHKFKKMDVRTEKEMVELEIILWQINDVATWAKTANIMLNIDLVNTKIDLPIWRIVLDGDQYLDGHRVTENMKRIYAKVFVAKANIDSHAPTVVARAKDAESMLPDLVRNELIKKAK